MPTSSFVMSDDMSDLCRVCLQMPKESQYLDLTTIYDEEDNLTYSECFTICTQIDLSAGEGVPHHLCKPCGLELQMSYDFLKKVEESKRVIEQCQRRIQVQPLNATLLQASNEQSKNLSISEEEVPPTLHVSNEKYAICDHDEHLQEGMEEGCTIQAENEEGYVVRSYASDETDKIEIINSMCNTETNMQNQLGSDENNSNLIVAINENDEENIEMDGYQNLEALEEEETETLQIKLETVESGEIEEYVDYTQDFNEEKENEEEKHEVDEEWAQEITEEEDQLRWQENVVAVANKEHLPIDVENDEEEGDEETTYYITSKYKNNDNQVTINDSSQDEAIEEESTEGKWNADKNNCINGNNNNNNNNNSKGRKRHVGSYSCDYCHRVYPNYSRMKTHRRCHETDRQKFSCSHCGRMYATKQARDCHIQTAHDKSGYTCSICSKVFAIRKSLEIHVRYHTGDFPYACKLCDRKFAQACHLNTHINVKHNKIRFYCDYPNCGKFFTSSSSLRNHEYTHGIMPFECEYCQQGYPAKSKLRIHIQRKHAIDMSNDQLERMRKFHVMRSKVNLVQFVDT